MYKLFLPLLLSAALLSPVSNSNAQEKETLPPLGNDVAAPQNFDEMWADFDPRAEPRETEIIKEWEEDGTVLRIVRFRIGFFKGQKSLLAGIFGFPKEAAANGRKIPGLLQIHGGGQYADHRACIANAKRGYATLSISWAGRISATDYRVDPNGVKLFWDQKTDDPNYRLTTDWGALDAYHAPSRNPTNPFTTVAPFAWTIDKIESPRNSPWFLCTLAARRALTFLEQQPEVDADRLGVYGHSMGGKLTVMTSIDSRVKAAAPSCGGISDRENSSIVYRQTIADDVTLKRIKCPIIFLSPSNDFHGRIGDLPTAVGEIQTQDWRVTCSPHLNHQDLPQYEVATLLWFDQHLKGEFEFPTTPTTELDLKRQGTEFRIKVDPNRDWSSVDVFYTQQGKDPETQLDRDRTMNRFWHHATVQKSQQELKATIENLDPERPLWIYANVSYPLQSPVSGAGYYYAPYTANTYNLSSLITKISSKELKAAGIKRSNQPSPVIENFAGDWKKEWYATQPNRWQLSTHKVFDPKYAAPDGAKLGFRVQCKEPNTLLVLVDSHVAEIQTAGDDQWQDVQLSPSEFKNFDGESLASFSDIKTLKVSDAEHLRGKKQNQHRVVGKHWVGSEPKFQNLRWVTKSSATSSKSSQMTSAQISEIMPLPKDNTSMWWRDGFAGIIDGASWRRIVKTGSYWFLFDTDSIRIARLGPTTTPLGEIEGVGLNLTVEIDGKAYSCRKGKAWNRLEGPRLIESGTFLQRADVRGLEFVAKDGQPLNAESRFESAAWADRLGLSLAVRPGTVSFEEAEASGGKIAGGFGLTGKNRFDIPPADCKARSAFSLSLWVFVPRDFKAGLHAPWLVCQNSNEYVDGNFGILLNNNAVPSIAINIGGGKENALRFQSHRRNRLKIDKWNHVVLTYDNKEYKLTANGQTIINEKVSQARTAPPGGLALGDRQDGLIGFKFRGLIDEVQLFDRGLNPNEIQRLFRTPQKTLDTLGPLKKWSFRNDVPAVNGPKRENWNRAKLGITLGKDGKELASQTWDLPQNQPWSSADWEKVSLQIDPVSLNPLPDSSSLNLAAIDKNSKRSLDVEFDPSIGWHRVNLDSVAPFTTTDSSHPPNDLMERVSLLLENPTDQPKVLRLMFEKTASGLHQSPGQSITGVTAMLRDANSEPTGIPVQLSKNWHTDTKGGTYAGVWFHGISQVRLPARKKIELELTLAYSHWGGVPAASHAQLSLIGYGGNHLWEQSAIGSWGESICYNPEQVFGDCVVTDIRPLMVKPKDSNKKWKWTENVGGADFFRMFNKENKRVALAGVRSKYNKTGPCLTDVVHQGSVGQSGINYAVQSHLSRTNDLVRATWRIRMSATQDADFSRFAFFQAGSDKYSYVSDEKMAAGNVEGPYREWMTQRGGNSYRGDPIECVGDSPWASLHKTLGDTEKDTKGGWATRGMIIRSWKATLGGQPANPWIAERGNDFGPRKTSLMEIVPPPTLTRFQKGDFVDAIIEFVVVPQYAAEYYGPNEELRNALKQDQDTWKMVFREAIKGKINVNMKKGKLKNTYPGVTVAASNDVAEFAFEGGLGYIPITITGLSSHSSHVLKVDGKPLDQSIHGKDFWQTDYDPLTKSWSRTYNLPANQSRPVNITIDLRN